jgi:hypothetical protein
LLPNVTETYGASSSTAGQGRRCSTEYGLSGIAPSGFGMDEDRAASEAAVFAEHFTKPVDVERLRNAIERLMTSNHPVKR